MFSLFKANKLIILEQRAHCSSHCSWRMSLLSSLFSLLFLNNELIVLLIVQGEWAHCCSRRISSLPAFVLEERAYYTHSPLNNSELIGILIVVVQGEWAYLFFFFLLLLLLLLFLKNKLLFLNNSELIVLLIVQGVSLFFFSLCFSHSPVQEQ